MGKLTISMAIFNSELLVYQRVYCAIQSAANQVWFGMDLVNEYPKILGVVVCSQWNHSMIFTYDWSLATWPHAAHCWSWVIRHVYWLQSIFTIWLMLTIHIWLVDVNILYYVILLYYCILYYLILYYAIFYSILLYYILFYCIVLYYIVLYHVILYCIILYCMMLYYIMLFSIILYIIYIYTYLAWNHQPTILGRRVYIPLWHVVGKVDWWTSLQREEDVGRFDAKSQGANGGGPRVGIGGRLAGTSW